LPEEQLNRHVEKVLRFVSTIAVITIVFVMLAGKWIVLLFYGAKFLPSQEPMQILVFGAALYIVSRTLMQVLGSRGIPEISAAMLFISVIINVGLCWMLVPAMGINGAAWASLGSNIFLLASHIIIVKKRYRLNIANCLLTRKHDIVYLIENLRTKVTSKANVCPPI
jgi:O-antigen/teichoic acid export membrane protein